MKTRSRRLRRRSGKPPHRREGQERRNRHEKHRQKNRGSPSSWYRCSARLRCLPDPPQLQRDVRQVRVFVAREGRFAVLPDRLVAMHPRAVVAVDRLGRTTRSPKRTPSRDHLVKDHAERKDVRPVIDRARFDLFRRHVLIRSDDRPFGRQRLAPRRRFLFVERFRDWIGELRETEIEQLRAAARDHDVARLQIAMDDAGAMGVLERLRDLRRQLQKLTPRQRPAGEQIGQRLSFEILHHQVFGVAVSADVVKRADVRMREPGNGARLAFETRT